jgi:hypothetical protein
VLRTNAYSRLAGALACVSAFAVAGCANGAAVSPVPSGPEWNYAGGVLYHAPHYSPTLEMARNEIAPNVFVGYHGGPVLVKPKVYLIFWGYKKYGDPKSVQKLLETYTKNMGGSGYNNIMTQYYEVVGPSTIDITNPRNQYGGSWNDESAIPKSPSDAQTAAEALRGVAHFGYDAGGLYIVATAQGRSEKGFGSHWCSYHSDTPYQRQLVAYANLPYMPDAGKQCGANIIKPPSDETGDDEGVTILGGHEYGEAYTDPYPFSAWNGSSGEIADICSFHDIKNDPFGKKSYTMQPLLSNASGSCVHSYP